MVKNVDDSFARKDWNWQPEHNLESALNDYLIPGVRVNGVCPASTHTPAVDRHIVFLGVDKESFLKDVGKRTFLKRIGMPEEVANVALFLASSEASYVTGTHVVVDGGVTASPFTK